MKSNALAITSGSANKIITTTAITNFAATTSIINSAIKKPTNSITTITNRATIPTVNPAIKKPTSTNIFRTKTSILFRRSTTLKKTPAVKIPHQFLLRDAMSLRPSWDKRTLVERYDDFLATSNNTTKK